MLFLCAVLKTGLNPGCEGARGQAWAEPVDRSDPLTPFEQIRDEDPEYAQVKTLRLTEEPGLAGLDVLAICQDDSGTYWFGTREHGLYSFDGKSWRHLTTTDGLLSVHITSILADRDGRLWLAGGGGVQLRAGDKWTNYPMGETPQMKGRIVLCMTEDETGHLRFGTDSGAVGFDGEFWTFYTVGTGPGEHAVYDVQVDRSGNIWFCLQGHGVQRLSEHGWEQHLPRLDCRAWLEDRRGSIWVGTRESGVLKYDGTEWASFLPGLTVLPRLQDMDGNLWFATEGRGAARFDGQNWTFHTIDNGLPSNIVRSIFEDDAGAVWIGTDSGVAVLK
jgi:ligand-binding sensor domain-containing protein